MKERFDFEEIYNKDNIKIFIENTNLDEKDVLYYKINNDITTIKDAVINCKILDKDEKLLGKDCNEKVIDYFNKYKINNEEKGLTCVAMELLFRESDKIKVKDELISREEYLRNHKCKPIW